MKKYCLIGSNPEYYFFGAYVQYVNFDGKTLASKIVNEHKFTGDFVSVLSKLDSFIETTIEQKHPVFVSALREETHRSFPHIAIRELLMNAVMHRDYESNAPIKFYEFADRLEIVNPGGLYGNARPENFPAVNDYRNPIVAEAMKVLGYVNKYNRGIYNVQSELVENGNGEAIFDFDKITVFGVTVNNALELLLAKLNIDRKDFFVNYKETDTVDEPVNINVPLNVPINVPLNVPLNKRQLNLYSLVQQTPTITIEKLSQILNVNAKTIKRDINHLVINNIVERKGSKKTGSWEVIK